MLVFQAAHCLMRRVQGRREEIAVRVNMRSGTAESVVAFILHSIEAMRLIGFECANISHFEMYIQCDHRHPDSGL